MNARERRHHLFDNDPLAIAAEVARATAIAIEENRRLGIPIAEWRDGRVVIVPPAEIPPMPDYDALLGRRSA